MKKHIFYILIGMAAMFSLASCVKDKLYLLPEDDPDYFNPDEWKQGTMVVRTDWSRTDQGIMPTDEYYLRLNDETYIVSDATNTFRHLHPEDYKVSAYYDPTGITIADNIATVDNEADGTLLRMPGMLVTLLLLTYRYVGVMTEELAVMTDAYRLRAPGQKGIHYSAWGSFLGQLLHKETADFSGSDNGDFHFCCLRCISKSNGNGSYA